MGKMSASCFLNKKDLLDNIYFQSYFCKALEEKTLNSFSLGIQLNARSCLEHVIILLYLSEKTNLISPNLASMHLKV